MATKSGKATKTTTKTDEVYAMAKKLADEMMAEKMKELESISGKNKKNAPKKDVCPAAVILQSHGKVNKCITGDRDVIVTAIKSDDGKTKTAYYAQCSRSQNEDTGVCWKHLQTKLKGETIILFSNVAKKDGARKMGQSDLLPMRKTIKETDNDPNPIISVKVSQGLKKHITPFVETKANGKEKVKEKEKVVATKSKTIKEVVAESEEEEEEEDAPQSDTKDSDSGSDAEASGGEAEANVSAEASAGEEENAEEVVEEVVEEETEATEIATKDGRKVYMTEGDEKDIYDEDSNRLGSLVEVTGNGSILYEETEYIVGVEFASNRVNYYRCAISNKLFKIEKGKLPTLAGKVDKQNNGTYKTVLTPKK